MKKAEFIHRLRKALWHMPKQNLSEIIADYEEHFCIGQAEGKSEEDIAAALGNPEQIASEYKFEKAVEAAEQSGRPHNLFMAILTGIGLGFFNLIFVLGVYVAILGSLLGFLVAGAALALSGPLCILKALLPGRLAGVNVPFDTAAAPGRLLTVLLGTGLFSLGALIVMGVCALLRLLHRGTLAYVKANAALIRKAGEA